jgi:serine/threonine protein kinase
VAASGPRRYAYRDLAAATNNFADDGKLGRGGFGSVYRGSLIVAGEERAVAIKMLSSDSSAQGRKEFEAEVRIISRLKHRNLVQLLGWCDSRHGLLLVYELVAQGSLDRHLHSSSSFLAWPERYQIILGLGSALRYLHQEWEQRVVHGDIKPSNIMLDDSLGAKLGDFGLARLGDHGGRWQTTKAVLGTAGYIDPEFVNTRHPSTHSDVYSFGIVLLEVVSGRSPVVLLQGKPPFVLLKWAWGLYGRNAILDAADERLRELHLHDECMERVLVVGLWCAHPDQSERPSIAQAMHVLQSEDARLPALPPQIYKTAASDLAVTGDLSVELRYTGDSSTTTTTTSDSKLSSGSSTTALLRDSKERS